MTTAIVTDSQVALTQHYEYSLHSEIRSQMSGVKDSSLYADYILDRDTGLYYCKARYYDPRLGRFIQPDTLLPDLSDPQSLNRYSYALNNPLKY